MEVQSYEHGEIIEVHVEIPSEDKSLRGIKICGEVPWGFSDAKTSSKDAQERSASIQKLLIAVVLRVIFMIVEVLGGHDHGGHGHDHGHGHGHGALSRAHGQHPHGHGDPEDRHHGISVARHHHHHHHHDHRGGSSQDDNEQHNANEAGVAEPLLKNCSEGEANAATGGTKPKRQRNINLQGALSFRTQGPNAECWSDDWWSNYTVCTLIFSALVLRTTIRILRNIVEVLMESTPREIDATKLENCLCEMDKVVAIHELHIWARTVGKVLLACHVKVKPEVDADMVLDKVIDSI